MASGGARGERLAWDRIAGGVDGRGGAATGALPTPAGGRGGPRGYGGAGGFCRARGVAGAVFAGGGDRGFGRGEYRYFAHPLPELVRELREATYPRLCPIANGWAERLRLARRFPETLQELLDACHAAGQTRPTPLLLKYGPDDYNCLHQDVYGDLVFPLQIAVLLSAPGQDFEGGELVLTEQRPRMQSRVEVVPLAQGEGVVFAVRDRPVAGTRGDYRVKMRHGVSRLRAGERFTLGVIFHDAA